jgi:hypothetical protein
MDWLGFWWHLCVVAAGQMQKQLQNMKLGRSPRTSSTSIDHMPSSPEPLCAEASESSDAALEVSGSALRLSRCGSGQQESSSRDVMPPPLTERTQDMQRALLAVRTKIIEQVGCSPP